MATKYQKTAGINRRELARENLKKKIIQVGFDLVKKKGLAGLGTVQIANKIGYSPGTLYNVFKDVSDIILHINATTLDKMRKFIETNLDPKLKEDKAVKQLAGLYLDFANKNPNIWGALFEYTPPPKQQLPQWYKDKISNLFGIIEQVLSKFITNREEASKQAKLIWATVHGIGALGLIQKLDDVKFDSAKALIDSWIETYLMGLKVQHKSFHS